jgi:hypothetical protein
VIDTISPANPLIIDPTAIDSDTPPAEIMRDSFVLDVFQAQKVPEDLTADADGGIYSFSPVEGLTFKFVQGGMVIISNKRTLPHLYPAQLILPELLMNRVFKIGINLPGPSEFWLVTKNVGAGEIVESNGSLTFRWQMQNRSRLKTTIEVATAPPASIKFPLVLPAFLAPQITAAGHVAIVEQETGLQVMFLEKLTAVDKNGVELNLSWRVTNGELFIDFAAAWSTAAYPAIIDPTVVDNTGTPVGPYLSMDGSGRTFITWVNANELFIASSIDSFATKTKLVGSGGLLENVACPLGHIWCNGNKIHLTYLDTTNSRTKYSRCVDATNWTTAANWKNAAETVQGPETPHANSSTGHTHIWVNSDSAVWFASSGAGPTTFVSYWNGTTWATSADINDQNGPSGTFAVDSAGFAFITPYSADSGALFYRKSTTANQVANWDATTAFPNDSASFGFNHYQVGMYSGGGIVFTKKYANSMRANYWNGSTMASAGTPAGFSTATPMPMGFVDGGGVSRFVIDDNGTQQILHVTFTAPTTWTEIGTLVTLTTRGAFAACRPVIASATLVYFGYIETSGQDTLSVDTFTITAAAGETTIVANRKNLAARIGRGQV